VKSDLHKVQSGCLFTAQWLHYVPSNLTTHYLHFPPHNTCACRLTSTHYTTVISLHSQAAVKALQPVRTTSLLVQQCQKGLNDISTRHAVGLYWVPGHVGVLGNEIADELTRDGFLLGFLGPERALEVSRRDIQKRISRWLVNQQWVRWRGLGDTQRQARELISGLCLDAKTTFLSNRTQSRDATGLLTGHNTLRRHLHLLGLLDSPLCRCGAEEETSGPHSL